MKKKNKEEKINVEKIIQRRYEVESMRPETEEEKKRAKEANNKLDEYFKKMYPELADRYKQAH